MLLTSANHPKNLKTRSHSSGLRQRQRRSNVLLMTKQMLNRVEVVHLAKKGLQIFPKETESSGFEEGMLLEMLASLYHTSGQ